MDLDGERDSEGERQRGGETARATHTHPTLTVKSEKKQENLILGLFPILLGDPEDY
jgi:hypothetical protein